MIHAAEKLRQIIKSSVSVDEVVHKTDMNITELKKFMVVAKEKEEEVIMANVRLIHSIARMFLGRGLDLDDLVYEGIRGLRKALTKFDFERGSAFSTYAYPWIKDYMRAALAAAHPIKLPRHVYKLAIKVNAIKSKFFRLSGYEPTDEELAAELGISMDRFEIVRRAMALVNRNVDLMEELETKPTSAAYDESTWEQKRQEEQQGAVTEHLVSREPQPHVAAGYNNVQQTMIAAVKSLPQKEAAAVLNRLGLGEEKLKEAYDSSDERSLYRRGMRKLRKIMLDPSFSGFDALDGESL